MTIPRARLAAALGTAFVLAVPAAAWAAPRRPVKVESSTTATTQTPATTATTALKTRRSAPAGRDLESLRSRCVAAIDVRLRALSAAKAALASAGHVTVDHRAALAALLDETTARLQALRTDIAADAEAGSLKGHCRPIFEDNRVFALVLPRMRLVVAADVSGAVAAKLEAVAGKLGAAIAEAEAAGRDMTQARADLEAMEAKIASAQASAASVPGTVLGLTPADWNADHRVLAPARQSLQSAGKDLRGARELAGKIRDQLKPKAGA